MVIDGLSFDVQRGETFGFPGRNISGKTTTIRARTGIYQPTSRTLHLDARDLRPEDGQCFGYLPWERGLYEEASVVDATVYFGRMKGLSGTAARQWSSSYLARVDLGDQESSRLDKLSSGQQQKVRLGGTIMNEPELLIRDEPTKGFDPVNRRLLMDIIEGQKKGRRHRDDGHPPDGRGRAALRPGDLLEGRPFGGGGIFGVMRALTFESLLRVEPHREPSPHARRPGLHLLCVHRAGHRRSA